MTLKGQYDYRGVLKDALARRISGNPRYSLRAFARDIGMSPQGLSLVLNKKKSISTERAIEISNKLNFSLEDTAYFVDLVDYSNAKTQESKQIIEFRLSRYTKTLDYKPLQEEVYKAISNWYHFSILELTRTQDFRNDMNWISQRLGISLIETKQAIERLINLGLLKFEAETLSKTELNYATTYDISSNAIRKSTKQILEKALYAIDNQNMNQREFGFMTMAIDTAKLPKAKEMIRTFRKQLCEFLETGKTDEVYVIATELFAVTRKG